MELKTTLTQWNKEGDHPLVNFETSAEFDYQESKAYGCGFINKWTKVWPGSYVVEVNGLFVGVISEDIAKIILNAS